MDMATIKQVHRWLNADVSGWLPPRVLCSARHLASCPVISASRSRSPEPRSCGCASARTWWETAFDESLGSSFEARLDAQIQRARLAVRKVELIARYHDSSPPLLRPLRRDHRPGAEAAGAQTRSA